MRSFVILALVLGCTGTAKAAPPEIHVYESATDDAITEGETIIATDPDTALKAGLDYPRWAAMFPDIRQVIVTEQHGDEALVTFVYTDDHRDNVHFHTAPAQHKVWFEDTHGRADVWAEIVFYPGMIGGTTRVHSRVYADVHGVTGLFVSDSKLPPPAHTEAACAVT